MGSDGALQRAVGIGRRLGYYFLLLVLANLVMYALVNFAPGNPFQSAIGSGDLEKEMIEYFGLDKPFMV